MTNIYTGQLVRLAASNPATDPDIMAVWHRDSEFFRLGYGRIAEPWASAKLKKRLEGALDEPNEFVFALRTLTDDKLIGQIGAWTERPHDDAYVWILIGDREYWGKGFGTDAMRVFMRYAFEELNLHRLTLRVFGFNKRAIRSYEKCGFRHEGVMRGAQNKIGVRWDEIWMGLTRQDWQTGGGVTL